MHSLSATLCALYKRIYVGADLSAQRAEIGLGGKRKKPAYRCGAGNRAVVRYRDRTIHYVNHISCFIFIIILGKILIEKLVSHICNRAIHVTDNESVICYRGR